ncbi:MAG: GyrI-like domain-containing protein [Pirellulaceae bacterium]|nr:GyrI-like domain-containing protein [Pirellulaceae bacterium]
MSDTNESVQEKLAEPVLIAGVRMRGKYSECGAGFKKIGRQFGRHICGKPMMLCYDSEYRENDADYEVCMPIRKGESTDDVQVRELSGGKCLSLLHHGPYSELKNSYAVMCQFVQDNQIAVQSPTREVYLKGPGMIFKGNPNKYVTEIQFPIAD